MREPCSPPCSIEEGGAPPPRSLRADTRRQTRLISCYPTLHLRSRGSRGSIGKPTNRSDGNPRLGAHLGRLLGGIWSPLLGATAWGSLSMVRFPIFLSASFGRPSSGCRGLPSEPCFPARRWSPPWALAGES